MHKFYICLKYIGAHFPVDTIVDFPSLSFFVLSSCALADCLDDAAPLLGDLGTIRPGKSCAGVRLYIYRYVMPAGVCMCVGPSRTLGHLPRRFGVVFIWPAINMAGSTLVTASMWLWTPAPRCLDAVSVVLFLGALSKPWPGL